MHVAAVVAEYNPLHKGHVYHLDETRRCGATHIVAILGGDFTQRGEPALIGKRERARAALLCGADLVIELPLPYAVAGAQRFARGAVALADALGAVESLSFGCECGSLGALLPIADAVESPAVREGLRRRLARGESFARARGAAVAEVSGPDAARALAQPNNILALEYLAALRALDSRVAPVAIARSGAGHDAPGERGGMMSASALRRLVLARGMGAAAPFIPPQAAEVFLGAPLCPPGALEIPLLSRLRALDPADLAALPEISEGIENRLYQAAREARTLEQLYALAKSKRYSHARVRRLALAAFLGLRDDLSAGPPPYLRVLGCNGRGRQILAGGAKLPIGASLARLARSGPLARRFAACEAACGDQYALMQTPRGVCGAEYTAPVIKI